MNPEHSGLGDLIFLFVNKMTTAFRSWLPLFLTLMFLLSKDVAGSGPPFPNLTPVRPSTHPLIYSSCYRYLEFT